MFSRRLPLQPTISSSCAKQKTKNKKQKTKNKLQIEKKDSFSPPVLYEGLLSHHSCFFIYEVMSITHLP